MSRPIWGDTLNTINNVERATLDPRKSTWDRIGGVRRKGGFNGVAIDPNDPPMYESQASYLEVPPPAVATGRGLAAEGCRLRAETDGPLAEMPELRDAIVRLTVFAFLAGCWCGALGACLASAGRL